MMANSAELSSSLSFTSSSYISNGSTAQNISASSSASDTSSTSLEIISLSKLSSNLEQLLGFSNCDYYYDAVIMVEGVSVGVHRCILAARSKLFYDFFKRDEGKGSIEDGGKLKYQMSDVLPYGQVGYEAFVVFLSYMYTGRLKPSPSEVSTCVDDACAHDACRPAISFVVELMYASAIFQVPELVLRFQRHLFNFVEKADVEDVIPILAVAFHCQSSQLLTHCVHRVARSDLDRISIEKQLPCEVAEDIRFLRSKSQLGNEDKNAAEADLLHEKRIRRIHKAMDSDDVELVKLLLSESGITLDEANALHYAAAYCDPKVVSEVLALGLADVNLRNARGYTVLHLAAIRKEPSVIVSLLIKGACAAETTSDGRSAVGICRRLTRPKDYNAKTEQGQQANKDRLCIDVLEREMRRNTVVGDSSISPPLMANDLHMRLLYLENRVAFARVFFPLEAKLAMDNAHAETTSEFSGLSAPKSLNGNLREVDLNETPVVQTKRLHSRMEALLRTVEMGRRYFPNCSLVLDKFMEDDLPDSFYLEKGTSDEQKAKRLRFMEVKEDVQRALNKDKAEINHINIYSTSSSSSFKSCKLQGGKL